MSKNNNFLGIDIGSITIQIAQLDSDKNVVKTASLFHEGKLKEKLSSLLEKFDLKKIKKIALTSSTPEIIKHSKKYDNRVSFITAAKHFHQDIGSLLIVGGEKFGAAFFNNEGEYLNFKSNSSCAAGTGSFLDQQAKRLNLKGIEQFSEKATNNKGSLPKIASRCAVFAKTDLIHAQQEGFSLEEICDGLSFGLAKNIVDTIFNNKSPEEPFILAGGVSLNKAVQKHLADLLNVKIKVDQYSDFFGAIGAALNLIDEKESLEPLLIKTPDDLFLAQEKKKNYHYLPLELKLSSYPDFTSNEKKTFRSKLYKNIPPVEIDVYKEGKDDQPYSSFLGIDIGSTSTKAIIIDENKEAIAGFYTRTSGQPLEAVQTIFEAIDSLKAKRKMYFDFLGVGTTGSGRKFIGKLIGSDLIVDEITAHAKAAYQLDSEVDTIIEIGGQDAKFTTLRNGMVTFSIMNNVCAAGTGSFIEEQAQKLNCPLAEYSARTEGIAAPLSSDRCTVFMERDLNHYFAEGFSINEILASVLHAVRENYLKKVAIEKNIGEKIFFQGATAKNRALVAAFEQRLGKPIMVSKYCHLTGALGVALYLADSKVTKSVFKGLDIYKKKIPIETEICDLCANHCKIKKGQINNEIVAYGFLCGRDYETKKYIAENKSSFDFLKARQKINSFKPCHEFKHKDLVVGIPAALYLCETLPLWKKFFDLLSIKTISSENYLQGVKEGKKITGAEFCAPIAALHGHVSYLSQRTNTIFLPNYLEIKQKNKYIKKQYCYYSQYTPAMVAGVKSIEEKAKIYSPVVSSVDKDSYIKLELFKMIADLTDNKISKKEVSAAYDQALKFYQKTKKELKKIYEQENRDPNELKVVFLGRPYTTLVKSMNNNIPEIFAKLKVKTFFQDMLSYKKEDFKSINPLLDAFHWNYAKTILEATEFITKTKNLYPVLITSFKCTPDSFVIEYFKEILDKHKKPYLILQLDEHDSNVGYETRIEAGVRSFQNHFATNKGITPQKISFDLKTKNKAKFLKGKTLLFPVWDKMACTFLTAILKKEGIDARLVEETPESIQKSLTFNTGQCIPLTAIAQTCIDYIEKHNLDPKQTVIWNGDSNIACNVRMFPYYIKRILAEYDPRLKSVEIYMGETTFIDQSFKVTQKAFFAYMFSGYLKKIGCKIRPYEKIKGETNQAIEKAINIFQEAFLHGQSLEKALKTIIPLFEKIETEKTNRPKVAIFGDLYVRENDVMNQNLIQTIEESGGEVILTPYSEYMMIIADLYIKKWFNEKYYSQALVAKFFAKFIPLFEKKYYNYFNIILKEDKRNIEEKWSQEKIFTQFKVRTQHTGESMENLLKIFYVMNKYPDISLFVQTNPAFCCPSLVTEAMGNKIEEVTGVPIVVIEYDGTGGIKNDDIIPYLKYPRS